METWPEVSRSRSEARPGAARIIFLIISLRVSTDNLTDNNWKCQNSEYLSLKQLLNSCNKTISDRLLCIKRYSGDERLALMKVKVSQAIFVIKKFKNCF